MKKSPSDKDPNYYGDCMHNGKTFVWHGTGQYRDSKGGTYQGSFQNGKFNGRGIYVLSESSVYRGTFSNHKYEGYGYYKDGQEIYKGEFLNDMREGIGCEEVFSKDGSIKEYYKGD